MTQHLFSKFNNLNDILQNKSLKRKTDVVANLLIAIFTTSLLCKFSLKKNSVPLL